ncbi:hypothetical protein DIPPA_16223 [Diplonema papillatum]|nr:hypothetical protein DIPPA_16223 [Diplonema papillatum]
MMWRPEPDVPSWGETGRCEPAENQWGQSATSFPTSWGATTVQREEYEYYGISPISSTNEPVLGQPMQAAGFHPEFAAGIGSLPKAHVLPQASATPAQRAAASGGPPTLLDDIPKQRVPSVPAASDAPVDQPPADTAHHQPNPPPAHRSPLAVPSSRPQVETVAPGSGRHTPLSNAGEAAAAARQRQSSTASTASSAPQPRPRSNSNASNARNAAPSLPTSPGTLVKPKQPEAAAKPSALMRAYQENCRDFCTAPFFPPRAVESAA